MIDFAAIQGLAGVKTYRRHNCTRKHRSFHAFAKCIWRRAEWVCGDGPWASVSYCRGTTVMLHPTFEAADAAKRFIDHFDCGGRCSRKHEIIRLEMS